MDDTKLSVDDFLKMMGLEGLEGQEKEEALDNILFTINVEVGKRVADSLTEAQAAEFEQLSDDSSAQEIASWMQKNVPNYNQLVHEETQKLHDEVSSTVKKVMGEE